MAVFAYVALLLVILVAYSALVKLRELDIRPAPPPADRKPDLRGLRERAEMSPSFANRIELAWGLMEHGQYEDAAGCFEQALSSHADDKEALYGLGRARLAAGNAAGAVEPLSTLIDRSFAYDDHGAARLLAEALYEDGQVDNGLALLSRIVNGSGHIEHGVALAKMQLRAERGDAAAATLRSLLETFESQPEFLRRRHGAAATDARRLLRNLEQSRGDG